MSSHVQEFADKGGDDSDSEALHILTDHRGT